MSKFRNPSPAEVEEFNKVIKFNSELQSYLVNLFKYLAAKKNNYVSKDDIDYLEFLLELKYECLYLIDPVRAAKEVPSVDDIIWK